MSQSRDSGWNDISAFLQQVDTSISNAKHELERQHETTRSKYQVDTLQDEVTTLDDAIEVIGQIRRFTKRGILISRGQE